jgi:MarR family transcriptional regulator, organic hydroperoxide resistance regulator
MTESVNFEKLSSHETPEQSPGYLLWQVSTRWRRAIEEVLKPLDLTHPQFVVLAITAWLTREKEKVSQVEIARNAGLDPNTTSQILRGLQAKGLIKRLHSTDERSKCPALTPEGAISLAKALPAVEKADEKFFSVVDLKKAGMLQALQKLAQSDTPKNERR